MVLAMAGTCTVATAPASADPNGNSEGTSDQLQAKLEKATKDYNNAQGRLTAAQNQAASLTKQINDGQAKQTSLSTEVGKIASASFRRGGHRMLNATLVTTSGDQFLEATSTISYLSSHDEDQIHALDASRKQLAAQRSQLNTQIEAQKKQVAALEKAKNEAQSAAEAAGGGGAANGPTGGSASANPAPRNPDGSWPEEGCTVKDPTTSGCVSPRMLHAYNEARAAGFTNYTACYRGGAGEQDHGTGHACDFAVTPGDFVDQAAEGSAKDYGNRLAAWAVANADRLAVSYVIWYRQIWLPGQGWTPYSGSGSPAAEHTNHVHISIQ